MAQDYVAWYRSIWGDEDWRALTFGAQHLYQLLATHPDRNAAGLLPLTPRKWSKLAAGWSVQQVREALAELDDAGFVVVDEDTEEVLVRSYIRRAEVYRHIRLLAMALREIPNVESERIQSAIGQELVRIPRLQIPQPTGRNQRMVDEAEAAQQRLDELASMLCDAPPDPPGNTAGQDAAPSHAPSHGGIPSPIPPGVRSTEYGAVPGGSSSRNKSLESNARARPTLSVVASSNSKGRMA